MLSSGPKCPMKFNIDRWWLLPFIQERSLPTLITVCVCRVVKSVVDKIIAKGMLAVLTLSKSIAACHSILSG